MNYSNVKYCDIANGTGVRTVLFVSGCRNHCPGCFQPETWNFCHGSELTREIEDQIIESVKPSFISGLTLLGGDPFEEENQEGLVGFVKRFKEECPDKTIWAFTGYLLEDLLKGGRKHTEYTDGILSRVDVLVDGPFILEQKNLMLKFRGSENQRLIDMNEFRKSGEITTILGS